MRINILIIQNDKTTLCILSFLLNIDINFLISGHRNMISSCDFSGDERRLCTGSWDKSVQIWDVHAGSYRLDTVFTISLMDL